MSCRHARSARLFVVTLSLLSARMALAHREDYIDETLVFQTLEEHVVEPEYWFDYGTRPPAGRRFHAAQRHP